jgi:hypothetical protein
MRAFRGSLVGITFSAAMIFCALLAKAQVPNGFTYEGLLEENGTPVNQPVSLAISLSDKGGTVLYTETFQNVPVTNGVFNVVIGDSIPFPNTLTFNEQYYLQVVVNGSTTIGPTAIWDAPYAINAGTVNGLQASPVPADGDLFPIPLGTGYTGTEKLDPAFLPSITGDGTLDNSGFLAIHSYGGGAHDFGDMAEEQSDDVDIAGGKITDVDISNVSIDTVDITHGTMTGVDITESTIDATVTGDGSGLTNIEAAWDAPGTIGSTTPNTGEFTNITASPASGDALTIKSSSGNDIKADHWQVDASGNITTAGHINTTSSIGSVTFSGSALSSASAAGSDVAGVITYSFSGGNGGACSITISFGTAYVSAPVVVLTPASSLAGSEIAETYVLSSPSNFVVYFPLSTGISAPPQSLNYIVIHP